MPPRAKRPQEYREFFSYSTVARMPHVVTSRWVGPAADEVYPDPMYRCQYCGGYCHELRCPSCGAPVRPYG